MVVKGKYIVYLNKAILERGVVMIKRIRCFIILFCCIMLSGCSNYFTPKGKPYSKISWVDFIKFNDITYYARMDQAGLKLTKDDFDKELYKVKFNVYENVHDGQYKIKNGDAAFLPVNTEVYSVKGFTSDFCLAAYNSKRELVLYFADTIPNAKKGEDLFDIKGKVESISINSDITQKELVLITDPKLIDKMADMIIKGSIEMKPKTSGSQRYYLKFNLKKGIILPFWYYTDDNKLTSSMGIVVPKEFGEIVQKAVGK